MLRHLLTSTSRLCKPVKLPADFGKNSTSSTLMASRSFTSHQTASHKNEMLRKMLAGAGIATAFLFTLNTIACKIYHDRQMCKITYDLDLMASDDAPMMNVEDTQNPMEGGSIQFNVLRPFFFNWKEYSLFLFDARVRMNLPHTSIATDFNEINDWLEHRGIHAEQSESGARNGLTEFATTYMHLLVQKHVEKKCDCCLTSAP